MKDKIQYKFISKMWKNDSPGGWHFVSLPQLLSKEIREHFRWQEEGRGRLKAFAEIEGLRWETAIWFDTKMDTYILPIKNEVRRKGKLVIDEQFVVAVWI